METLVIELAISIAGLIPKIIDAVESSSLSPEAKKAYLDKLSLQMDDTAKRVAAVKFRPMADDP